LEQILDGYACNLEGYLPRPLHLELTWEDACYVYRLIPSPPRAETGRMDDYIRNVVNLEGTVTCWDMGGVPADVTENKLMWIAANDEEWSRICYLFGNLVAGFSN
jgi:hypothetical protein